MIVVYHTTHEIVSYISHKLRNFKRIILLKVPLTHESYETDYYHIFIYLY